VSLKTNLVRTFGLAAAGLSLAGCVSLFPKSDPVQMYRFGVIDAPAAAASANAPALGRAPTAFARAAAGDRILTITGTEAAYISDARWVSPAALMFDDAVERAFDARPGGPRLVSRGDPATATSSLRLDVDTFETRYVNGPETAPTVVVSFRASVVRGRDRAVMAERIFSASKPAIDNRLGAIVDAYDSAVRETTGQLAEWAAGAAG
jgi:cholesterol transport system auxiliary component